LRVKDIISTYFENDTKSIIFWLGILTVLLWLPIEYGGRYLHTQVPSQIIIASLTLLLISQRKENILRYPLWGISIFWIFMLFISFIFSYSRLATLEEVMRNVMYITIPILIFTWADNKKKIKLLSYTVISVGTLVCIIALFYFFLDYINTLSFVPASMPLSRTNDLGAYALLIFSLSVSVFLYENKNYFEKFIYAVSSLLSFIVIIFTFSRGIWVSTLIVIIIILFFGRKILKKNIIYIGIFFTLSLIPIIFKWEEIVTRILSLQNILKTAENSIEWRKSLLRGTLNIFFDNPIIGTGLNSFPFVYTLYQEKAGYFSVNPHNYYLQLLAEVGITGLTTFIIFILSIIYLSFKAFKNSEDIFKGIALGLLTGIISSLIHISVDIDWSVISIPVLFWIKVGLLMSIYREVSFVDTRFKDNPITNKFDYIKKTTLIFISICLFSIPLLNLISLNMYTKSTLSDDLNLSEKYIKYAILFSPYPSARHHLQYATILYDKNKLQEAIKIIDKALKLDKFNYLIYKKYSEILMKLSFRNKDKAIEMLIKAVELNPYAHPRLYGDVGDFYIKYFNDKNKAIEWYKKGIQNFPIEQLFKYEGYTPGDRYELYDLYKKLYTYDKKNSKDYKSKMDFIIKTQPKENSLYSNSTITETIYSYWNTVNKGENERIFLVKDANFPEPVKKFKYKVNEILKIERKIFDASIEYNISIINNSKKRDFILIDKLILTNGGWFINDRKIKSMSEVKNE
jgi:O-antigen ligase